MSEQETHAPMPSPTLEGTLWQVASAVEAKGTLGPVPDGVVATARFAEGRVSGSGGCNRYTAAYILDGRALSVGLIASTMMACPDPAGAFESGFLAVLATTASWEVVDRSLILRDGNDRPTLVFRPVVEPSLTGAEWSAAGVNNGKGGVASLVADTVITATFGEDGPLFGSGGCNRYRGQFTVDGARITIGPLATTRMACPGPVMEQEAQYLAALGRATTWRIDGDTLELRDADGALQVSFRAGG
jgi:heat shock protein HslJ